MAHGNNTLCTLKGPSLQQLAGPIGAGAVGGQAAGAVLGGYLVVVERKQQGYAH